MLTFRQGNSRCIQNRWNFQLLPDLLQFCKHHFFLFLQSFFVLMENTVRSLQTTGEFREFSYLIKFFGHYILKTFIRHRFWCKSSLPCIIDALYMSWFIGFYRTDKKLKNLFLPGTHLIQSYFVSLVFMWHNGNGVNENPLPFCITFWQKTYPFRIPVFWKKRYPVHIYRLKNIAFLFESLIEIKLMNNISCYGKMRGNIKHYRKRC